MLSRTSAQALTDGESETGSPVRVLLAEDLAQDWTMFEALIRSAPGLEYAGLAKTVGEVIPAVEQLNPHVLLLDLGFGRDRVAGIGLSKEVRIKRPQIGIFVLTEDPRLERLEKFLAAQRAARNVVSSGVPSRLPWGGIAYMGKMAATRWLEEKVRLVAAGYSVIDPRLEERYILWQRFASRFEEERWIQGLEMATGGVTYEQIAEKLDVDRRSPANWVSWAKEVFGIPNGSLAQVARWYDFMRNDEHAL